MPDIKVLVEQLRENVKLNQLDRETFCMHRNTLGRLLAVRTLAAAALEAQMTSAEKAEALVATLTAEGEEMNVLERETADALHAATLRAKAAEARVAELEAEAACVVYDEPVDVLYLSLGEKPSRAYCGCEAEATVVWRYDAKGDVIGVTIVDFKEQGRNALPAPPGAGKEE